jgi:DNA modification methylase
METLMPVPRPSDTQGLRPYYDHAGIQIFLGDCRDILPSLTADVLVTDPPYGVNFCSGWANGFRDVRVAGDDSLDSRNEVLRICGDKPALIFGTWKVERPEGVKAVLIWDKGTVGMGDLTIPWFPCTEEIYVLGSGWQGTRTSAVHSFYVRNTFHPTEKPVDLMNALLLKCPEGIVCDPFCGSGSTLVAAKNQGRKAIGIEIEERYCEIAAKRLSQEVLNFGAAGRSEVNP